MDAYVTAWKLGLKAVAIYRDGSKRMQPLTTSTTQAKAKPETVVEFKPVRRRLPDEREAMTKKFSVAGHKGYVTVGMYEDGTPGELFIVMSKEGSTISGLMDGFATAISLALQYGVPLHVLVNKFAHTRFEPAGFTGDKDIPIAKSIFGLHFPVAGAEISDAGRPPERPVRRADADAERPRGSRAGMASANVIARGGSGAARLSGTGRRAAVQRLRRDYGAERHVL